MDKELVNIYIKHPGSRVELKDDDSIFLWAPGVQLSCDFDVPEVTENLFDSKESTVRFYDVHTCRLNVNPMPPCYWQLQLIVEL